MNRTLLFIRLARTASTAWHAARLRLASALLTLAERVLWLSVRVRRAGDSSMESAPPPESADAPPLGEEDAIEHFTVGSLIAFAEEQGGGLPLTVRLPRFKITIRQVDETLEAMIGRPGRDGGQPPGVPGVMIDARDSSSYER